MNKIGELRTKDNHFVIYRDSNKEINPYSIYNKWYDNGWHKRLLVRYQDLYSCVLYIGQRVHDRHFL